MNAHEVQTDFSPLATAEMPNQPESPEENTAWENIKNLFRRVRTSFTKVMNSLENAMYPAGLTAELEGKILERIREKMQGRKHQFFTSWRDYLESEGIGTYMEDIDRCINESLEELLPPQADRKNIYQYFWEKYMPMY